MPLAKILIEETAADQSRAYMKDVRDLEHAHRLLLQVLFTTTKKGSQEIKEPKEKLALLRSFLVSLGIVDDKSAQGLLIMALFQIADEVEGKRLIHPKTMTNIIT